MQLRIAGVIKIKRPVDVLISPLQALLILLKQYRKLIAADSCSQTFFSENAADDPCGFQEQKVSLFMAKGIVNLFQAVYLSRFPKNCINQ